MTHGQDVQTIKHKVKDTCYSDVFSHPKWCSAIKQEIDALEKNETWTLTSFLSGKHVLDCKWVSHIQYKAHGTIERYKERLVILANTETKGIYSALVVNMVTVRTSLSVASSRNWPVH